MNNKKNFISAIMLQIVTIVQGLILPRLLISTFGSDVNGMVSSITQFLSFISLLEGGLGAVVLAELYVPIENNDTNRAKQILFACQSFFKKLALIFIAYTIFLAVVYPIFIAKNYNFYYTSSLILIISVATLVQYLFSITNKLLLQASQKVYIVNILMTITVILNLLLSVIVIIIYPNIHIVKLAAALAYLIQPIVYGNFVEKKYSISRQIIIVDKKSTLKNRWSGFAQNLAYFINMNTDIAVLTFFAGFSNVSVYSVYMLAINALRAIITSAANSYQSALGKYYAEADSENLKQKFQKFECSFWLIAIVLFCTCLVLINPFVSIYTKGIHDANYYRPVFAMLIVLANMIYCAREPYRLLILAAGKFKETNFGSIAEAILNLGISLALVWKFGLVGVAIGTFIATTYRLFYFIWYLKKDILYFNYRRYIALFITAAVMVMVNVAIYLLKPILVDSFLLFLVYGVIALIAEGAITLAVYKILKIGENIVMKHSRK